MYEELKKAAQNATPGEWRAGNAYDKPFVPKYEVIVDTQDGPYVILSGNHNFIEDAEANIAFVGAANPSAVLALIAENDRVKARLCACRDCGGQGEVYSGHDSYQGHFQPPEPDMDVCGTCGGDGVLGPLEDFEALAVERDQLKADNEALHKECARLVEDNRALLENPGGRAMTNCYGLDVDYFRRKMERMLGGADRYTPSEWARECARMAKVADDSVLLEAEFVGDVQKNADRYQVLRQADIDTIHNGGLFAGLTPENIVINGCDLDKRTDAVIESRKGSEQ